MRTGSDWLKLGITVGVLTAGAAVADQAPGTQSNDPKVQRGAYLVQIGGCNDCHTPMKMTPNGPAPDTARLLSGQPQGMKMPPPPRPRGPWIASTSMTAWAGPWGISYAANLTPDPDTGLGKWDEATFVKTLRTGKVMGTGRPILPPMPWAELATMTDQDLSAVWAYLRSIPAVKNKVPEPVMAKPHMMHKSMHSRAGHAASPASHGGGSGGTTGGAR